MNYVWIAIVGLVVGLLARFLLPGKQPLGWIITALLGIAGAYAATYGGQALGLYRAGQSAGFIGSVIGAMVLLFIGSKLSFLRNFK